MTRKLILALAILAIATGPAQARGGGHGSSGSHSHGHHHPVHLFGGFPFWGFPFGGVYTQFPYGYPCLWDEGQWVNQFYGDRYGNSTDVLEWVPGRWMCPDADDPAQWTHVAKGTRTILTSPSQTRDRTPSRPAGGSKRSTTLRGGGRGVRHDVPFPGACEQGVETLEECHPRNMLTGEVTAMPRYAFICEKCRKPFELTMTLSEREKSKVSCPTCKSAKVTTQLAPFMTQTSKKS